MLYACTAAIEEGARCRHFLEQPGEMCELHLKKMAEGKEVKLVPAPDTILAKFNINSVWAQKFEQAGIPRRFSDEVALEEKHIKQARKIDREPYRFRDTADSGVPVFGPQGVSAVSILKLIDELQENGYNPQDVHIRTRTQKRFDVLVIPFTQETGGNNLLPNKALELLREFLRTSCWGFVHVWANPPDETGKIVHTVNLSHREPEKFPQWNLCFNQGLWALESTVQS